MIIILRNEGYCIIENVFEDSFVEEIRKKIISLAEESGRFLDFRSNAW